MREPAVVLLYGYPAAGKFTIARELASRLEAAGGVARVIDNHYVNNVVFGVLDIDGVKPITPDVWRKVREVRETVFSTIREMSPPHFSFVFTNHLVKDKDEWGVDELRELARARDSRFVVARLECNIDELCARVDAAERRQRLKWADPVALRSHYESFEMIEPIEGELKFDTAVTAPADVAAAIAAQLVS